MMPYSSWTTTMTGAAGCSLMHVASEGAVETAPLKEEQEELDENRRKRIKTRARKRKASSISSVQQHEAGEI
jgi:hypothetical protein